MRRSFRFPCLLTALLALAGVFPGTPMLVGAQESMATVENAVPWEALLVDHAGARLLGHGQSEGGTLVLELGTSVERFVLILVGPPGTLERFEGYVDIDGTLLVSVEESGAPTLQTLQAVLERRGLALQVVRSDQESVAGRRQESPGTPGDPPDDDGEDDHGDEAVPDPPDDSDAPDDPDDTDDSDDSDDSDDADDTDDTDDPGDGDDKPEAVDDVDGDDSDDDGEDDGDDDGEEDDEADEEADGGDDGGDDGG